MLVSDQLTSVTAVGKRVEHRVAGLRRRLDEVEDVAHRYTAPFGNAQPALDAEVHLDLLLLVHRLQLGERQLGRPFDQADEILATTDPHPCIAITPGPYAENSNDASQSVRLARRVSLCQNSAAGLAHEPDGALKTEMTRCKPITSGDGRVQLF